MGDITGRNERDGRTRRCPDRIRRDSPAERTQAEDPTFRRGVSVLHETRGLHEQGEVRIRREHLLSEWRQPTQCGNTNRPPEPPEVGRFLDEPTCDPCGQEDDTDGRQVHQVGVDGDRADEDQERKVAEVPEADDEGHAEKGQEPKEPERRIPRRIEERRRRGDRQIGHHEGEQHGGQRSDLAVEQHQGHREDCHAQEGRADQNSLPRVEMDERPEEPELERTRIRRGLHARGGRRRTKQWRMQRKGSPGLNGDAGIVGHRSPTSCHGPDRRYEEEQPDEDMRRPLYEPVHSPARFAPRRRAFRRFKVKICHLVDSCRAADHDGNPALLSPADRRRP